MLISEATVTQDILFVCDMLQSENKEITIDNVWRRLVKEYGYEYPRDFIEKIIQVRDSYVWNVKTHGYEKGEVK